MKLWILRPVEGLPDNRAENPWEPWYDKAFGFIVRAESESRARVLADAEAGDEKDSGWSEGWTGKKLPDRHPWLESKYSTCSELLADGPDEIVIMKDFYAA